MLASKKVRHNVAMKRVLVNVTMSMSMNMNMKMSMG